MKNTPATSNPDLIHELQQAVAADLPGWKISDASLQDLKDKQQAQNSGHTLQKGSSSPAESMTQTPKSHVVLVQPQSGGPAKVADYKNGKIDIVQG